MIRFVTILRYVTLCYMDYSELSSLSAVRFMQVRNVLTCVISSFDDYTQFPPIRLVGRTKAIAYNKNDDTRTWYTSPVYTRYSSTFVYIMYRPRFIGAVSRGAFLFLFFTFSRLLRRANISRVALGELCHRVTFGERAKKTGYMAVTSHNSSIQDVSRGFWY